MDSDALMPQSYLIVTEADSETQAELVALLEAYRSSLKAHGLLIQYNFTPSQDGSYLGRFVVLVEPTPMLSNTLKATVDAEVRALSDALSVIAAYEVNTFFKN